jgi:hypothetical protein
MTQDFRQPSPMQTSPADRQPLDAGRRLVVLILYATAIGFLLAGVWLMVGEQALFPPEIAPVLGVALIVSAVSDVVAVMVFKRIWAKRTGKGA